MLFKKSQHGWRLMRQSLAVLAERKKLLIWPLIGRGIFLLTVLAIIALAWVVRSGIIKYEHLTGTEILWGYVGTTMALWISNGISAFCYAAFLAHLIQPKEQNSLIAAWHATVQQFSGIISWVLVHFTIGIVVNLFWKKFRTSNQVKQRLSGLNWVLATFLLFPVMLNERTRFLPSLKRSSQLVVDYAGLSPQLNYSYTWLNIGLRILSFVPLLIGDFLGKPITIVAGITVTSILLLGITVLLNSVPAVIQQGIYLYLAQRQTMPHFRSEDIATAVSADDL